MTPQPRSCAVPLLVATVVLVALLSACVSIQPTASTPAAAPAQASTNQSVDAFFAAFTDEWMRRQPSASTASGYFQGEVQAAMDRQLTPDTPAFRAETVALARRGLARLAGFDRAAMSDPQRVSAELMAWQLQAIIDGERFSDLNFPLQQFGGANVGLPNLMTVIHPVRSARDADNYLARLRLFEARMGEAVVESRDQAARGILPPRFILQATIAQMRTFIAPQPATNPLVTTLVEKLGAVDGGRRNRAEKVCR